MSDQVFWYATRAAGIMCWLAACASVAVGVLMSSRALGPKPTLPWLTDLHRYLSGMAMAFLWLHMVTLGLDAFIGFGWKELFIPGAAEVPGISRFGLALGVVSAWLMAAVELTSLVRRHLPRRLWHRIHLSSYATVLLTTVHAWTTGSDVTNHLLIGVAASTLTGLVLVTGIRVYWVLLERKARYELALRQQQAAGGTVSDRPVPPDPPGYRPPAGAAGGGSDEEQVPERFRWPRPADRAQRGASRTERALARSERKAEFPDQY